MHTAYLLTGMPGSGKTSLIRQAVREHNIQAGGFYTEEIRLQGVRQGFRVVTLDGQNTLLAHIDIHSPYKVSKYGVDIEGLERIGIPALQEAAAHQGIVVIDEIGKMELFSEKFKAAVLEILGSGKKVLGTIMLKPDPWADAIKRLPEVKLITITRNNHQPVMEEILKWMRE
jgi:nucleoside-triphosphatase